MLYCEIGAHWLAANQYRIDEALMCVTLCPKATKWSAGFACKLKQRQAVANLFLAIALASDTKHLLIIKYEFLEFLTTCKSAGLDVDLDTIHWPETPTPTRRTGMMCEAHASGAWGFMRPSNGGENILVH